MARPACKRVLISTVIVLILLISSCTYFLAILPYQTAANHEQAYFNELYGLSTRHSPYTSDQAQPPQKAPIKPLIHNAFQLSSFAWENELSLYTNGTAKFPMQRRWVYVAGTPKQARSWREKTSLCSPPGKGSCADSPSICADFNNAFNTLAQSSLGPNRANRIRTSLAFFDCDNSPLLCDMFKVEPVLLLHLETKPPCFVRKNYSFECSTRWTYISLPLKKMPFERKVWIGGFLVAAFPSAEEQLGSLMLWEGLAGLGLEEEAFRDTLVESEEDLYTFEGVVREKDNDLYEEKLQELAAFFSFILEEMST